MNTTAVGDLRETALQFIDRPARPKNDRDSQLDVSILAESHRQREPALLAPSPEFAVVVPTFNERANVEELVRQVSSSLAGVRWELIIVDDDSPDGTADAVRQISQRDSRVRCIQRIGRRGLSSACIEGFLASSAPVLAVMDGDLQHDPAVLPRMYAILSRDEADVTIGSRYADGGSVGKWDERRQHISRIATRLSDLVSRRHVSDPMSGFFAIRREVLDTSVRGLSNLGFKVLLDILATSGAGIRVRELPFTFRTRHAGESKLSANVVFEFLLLLADKMVGRYLPVRFLAFAAIGAMGVGVHFVVLATLFKVAGLEFSTSQAVATASAIVFNFSVNNLLTYSGQSLRGVAWVRGLTVFSIICGVGAVANVGLSSYLFGRSTTWMLAAFAGIALGAVWNYAVSARYTWRVSK